VKLIIELTKDKGDSAWAASVEGHAIVSVNALPEKAIVDLFRQPDIHKLLHPACVCCLA
jgi:hypothetical protein